MLLLLILRILLLLLLLILRILLLLLILRLLLLFFPLSFSLFLHTYLFYCTYLADVIVDLIRIVNSHFWLWYCTTAWSYFATGALLFKIIVLITISYKVGILMWLQHTFTERRNHVIRGKACLLTCLQYFRFYRQNDRPKLYISFCRMLLTLAINSYT